MKKSKYLLAAICLISCEAIFSETLDVPANYTSIQKAINAAKKGDTVLVSPGRYYENINFRGKSIVVASKYALFKDTSFIGSTIIDGSKNVQPDSGTTVSFLSGEDSSAVLQGFTITGGSGTIFTTTNGSKWTAGGGVIMKNSRATIKNNYIVDNAIKPRDGSNNGGGGGINCFYGDPTILNNVIAHNFAYYACGIVLNWSKGVIRNNVIYANYGAASFGAGGIMVWDIGEGRVLIENNSIIGNKSDDVAGAIRVENSSPVIRNNVIWGNRQAKGSQIVQSNAKITYCDLETQIAGEGNIYSFPMLQVDSFTLASGSPCIDAGNESAEFSDTKNPSEDTKALVPSRGGIRNDIGAYGGPGASVLSKVSSQIFYIGSGINFGDVVKGKNNTLYLEILNIGNELKIDTFYLVNNNVKIEKGINKKLAFLEKDTFKISWTPTSVEKMSDTLKIFHSYKNIANPKIIVINGNAKPAVSIKNVDSNNGDKISVAPNPCKGLSIVSFKINSASEVKLNLFDMNGRVVKCLYNKLAVPGNYESELNASELKTGVYLLKLITDNSSVIEKVVVK